VDDASVPALSGPITCGDHKVTLIRQSQNGGITRALNRGLEHVLSHHYAYVARIDAKDVAVRGRVVAQETFLRNHPECGLVGSFVDFTDEQGTLLHRHRSPTAHREIMQQMHIRNCILHASVMIRVEAFRHTGVYTERYGVAGEDYVLFMDLAKYYKLAVIPEVLTLCEDNLHGISVKKRYEQQLCRLRVQLRSFDPWAGASYYGVTRTLLAMITPRCVVVRYKCLARGVASGT